ncbi:hypothetical protein CARUB_v10023456mg [Capsella rubella]|uniref:Uncharacterized protein n=1 Tax=Capsella rubella TaxID=81985 RepID=R0HPX6_9BRAS|nr:hypothetical protein CARUB_v10023456mg [Capsella rubella]
MSKQKEEATSSPLNLTGLNDALPRVPDEMDYYTHPVPPFSFNDFLPLYHNMEGQRFFFTNNSARSLKDFLPPAEPYNYEPPSEPPQPYSCSQIAELPEPQLFSPPSEETHLPLSPSTDDQPDYDNFSESLLDMDEPPYEWGFGYEPPTPTAYVPMPSGDERMFGKVGLHCYNLQNRTNLKFFCHDDDELFYELVKFYATDPTRWYSTFEFITRVVEFRNEGYLTFITTQCTLLPEEEAFPCDEFDKLAVDDFFRGDMPNSMPEDTTDNLQYYELKESEVEAEKDWLRLYLELALHTNFFCFPVREKT